jgi:hypothetical protein
MALEGTIKDFGLADIFQLIGLQRRSGTLTLDSEQDTVTVKFLEGAVVGADTRQRNLEDLLGAVLVRTGRITEGQLQEALKIQKSTLQRLGYIFVRSEFISEEDLREALRVQVTQIVYRLFRWRDGKYRFDPQEHVEYDREHFQPIPSETILMEGARMVDEWPIIERKIRSANIVFRKTAAGAALEAPVRSMVEVEGESRTGVVTFPGHRAGEIQLSQDERGILRMVDGRASVQEIVDRTPLGEFDTYRILHELLNRNLIEEIQAVPESAREETRRLAAVVTARVVIGVLIAISAFSALTLKYNPWTPWSLGFEDDAAARLRTFASRARLETIEQAIRTFYLDLGAVPDRLELLAETGYLTHRALVDPWGRPYRYAADASGYRVMGTDAEDRVEPNLTVLHTYSPGERLTLQTRGGTPGAQGQAARP